MALSVLAINCTLKRSPEPSSCGLMLDQILDRFSRKGVKTGLVRAADLAILPGVSSDEGPGDAWPGIRQRVLDADIFLLGTPIWLGHPSSLCQRVLERLDAFLGEKDDRGHMPSYGRVALAAVVGNEDGAHHVHAEIFQALNDVGFTIPANGSVYWVGEAMHKTDYKDLSEVPEPVAGTMDMMVSNSLHLAALLKERGYPPL